MSDTYLSKGIKLVKSATGYWRVDPLPSEQFLAEHEAGLAPNLWAALAQLSLGRTVTLIATCED